MVLALVLGVFVPVAKAGVIYMDEDFEGIAAFVDRNWPVAGDGVEPTTGSLVQGVNLRRWSGDAQYSTPKVAIGVREGGVVSTRAFRGANCYQLSPSQSLAVTPGQFPFRNGSGTRCWQFAVSTDIDSISKPTGTLLGLFEITYASASTTSLIPDCGLELRLLAAEGGKADLVCVNTGATLGSLTGAPDDWLLVTIIAMNRINPGTLADTFSQWVTYDPLSDSYKGPEPGVGTGIHVFAANSVSGALGKTVLRRGAELPSSWGNYPNHTLTSEIGWRFAATGNGTLFLDNLYWGARTHESADGGFDHERGARIEAFPSGLSMGFLFTDNAVLQREKPLPIWGKSIPGDSITVRLAGQVKTTTADGRGDWLATLDPLPAGGPYDLTVDGESTITIQNVMLGDVWVNSGQSNMAFTLNEAVNSAAEVAAANYPNIRLLSLWAAGAKHPIDYGIGSWQPCSPESAASFSAVAYFFGRDVHTALDPAVPIGLINTSFGGTRAETWTSVEALADSGIDPADLKASWGILGNGELFNGMINPLVSYPITGANWYQGESNADKGTVYAQLLSTMIGDWRTRWGLGDFQFQIVQLPNMQGDWGGGPWPIVREAQLEMLKLPNTALAVTIDVGTDNDVHPKNKAPVGHRLALPALAMVYGQDVDYSGPLLQRMTPEADGWMRLDFRFAADGLVDPNGGSIQGFEVAGEDQVYYPAEAEYVGQAARVRNASVPTPRYVRYAWSNTPPVDLYNSAQLPASPFRVDLLAQEPTSTMNGLIMK